MIFISWILNGTWSVTVRFRQAGNKLACENSRLTLGGFRPPESMEFFGSKGRHLSVRWLFPGGTGQQLPAIRETECKHFMETAITAQIISKEGLTK